MQHFSFFPLSLILATAYACILFHATAPYDDHQPYVASITHNGVLTCWLSMTYARHMHMQKHTPAIRKQAGGDAHMNTDMEWEFLPWEFECLDGFEARALVGRRSCVYRARGRGYAWTADSWEDIWGRAYRYSKQLDCGGKTEVWMA